MLEVESRTIHEDSGPLEKGSTGTLVEASLVSSAIRSARAGKHSIDCKQVFTLVPNFMNRLPTG